MKSHIKKTLCTLYKYSGFLPVQEIVYRWTCDPFLVVLLFHRVTDEIPEDGLTVSLPRFRTLCHMLANRFRVVPLGEVFRLLRSGKPLPPRTVAITFDDCYRDNLPAAHVLAEYGLPATFFIPTAYVGTDHVFPWDRNLKQMPNLNWEEVARMHRLGFEIGSHTHTHANLGAVSAEQAYQELVVSKVILEDRLGSSVRLLAYPFGGANNFRRDWLPLMKQAGYEGCVSAYGGFIYPRTDQDILPRQSATGFSSTLSLEVFLTGSLAWYYAFKRRIGLSEPWQTFVPSVDCPLPPNPQHIGQGV